MSNYTHLFHPYPAKFPPQIIRDYISLFTQEGDVVLDPFCGSGTALVEARLLGRSAIGIELNPIGALISKSKAEFYSNSDIVLIEKFIDKIKHALNSEVDQILPDYPNRNHWFKEVVINELNTIKFYIEKEKNNEKLYNLLLTAFSKIIVKVSNQDTETRYASVEKKITKGDTLSLYIKTLETYIKALNEYTLKKYNSTSVEVIEGDTLNTLDKLSSSSVELVITSPPYINSFDYYLYHKHRIFLLGKEPLSVRKKEIGGHHTIDTQSFDKAFNNYYTAMYFLFENVHRILRRGKKFILLIGDGIVKGKVINVDKVMIDISKKTHFKLHDLQTAPLSSVSKTFIKGKNLAKKQHHVIIFER